MCKADPDRRCIVGKETNSTAKPSKRLRVPNLDQGAEIRVFTYPMHQHWLLSMYRCIFFSYFTENVIMFSLSVIKIGNHVISLLFQNEIVIFKKCCAASVANVTFLNSLCCLYAVSNSIFLGSFSFVKDGAIWGPDSYLHHNNKFPRKNIWSYHMNIACIVTHSERSFCDWNDSNRPQQILCRLCNQKKK